MGQTVPVERRKHQAALLSLAFNVFSALVKVAAAAITGSVGLLSEAIHSSTDVLASLIALISVRAAAVPPDEDHPYGHGKIESLSAFGESILLLAIVVFVVVESVQRLIAGATLSEPGLGIGVMAVSALGALLVGIFVQKVGREGHSLALLSNAQHLFVDAVTSAGVLISLLVVSFSGWKAADPIMALLIAVWMAYGAGKLLHRAFHELIDARLEDAELARIRGILDAQPDLRGYHRLRTRRLGNTCQVDLHIEVPRDWDVVRAHELADRIEQLIETELAPAQATIHVDPEAQEPGIEPR